MTLIGRLKAEGGRRPHRISKKSFRSSPRRWTSRRRAGAVDQARRQYRLRDALGPREQYDVIAVAATLARVDHQRADRGGRRPCRCCANTIRWRGLSQLTQTIRQIKKLYNPALELVGVLINMYDGRLNLTVQVMDESSAILRTSCSACRFRATSR